MSGMDEVGPATELHYSMLQNLRDGTLAASEEQRASLIDDFLQNRRLAAQEMIARDGALPPNMGEDLIVSRYTTPWPEYERVFFEFKQSYSKVDEWRHVARVCHAHCTLDAQIDATYRKRAEIGVEPTIPLCRQQMAIAEAARIAIIRDEELMFDFRTELQIRYLANRGKTPQEGWMPEWKSHGLPEHRGFKQLSIIYAKQHEWDAAIHVCRGALAVGWPGDWETRIARCEGKLKRQMV